MPKLISEVNVLLERSDTAKRVALPRDLNPDGTVILLPRRPGLHLSGLLKYVATTSKITDRMKEVSEESYPLIWGLGIAWEEYAASYQTGMVWQPGEIDWPVIMNCDGITLNGMNRIEEFKFTRTKRKSGEQLITDKWLWMNQGMGYCLGYGLDIVRWHVCWAMEWPEPIYTQYTIQFTDDEIEGCRRMIEVNREGAIKNGYEE